MAVSPAPWGSLGRGPLVNNGAFVLNRPDAVTISNNISGAGSLTKLGTNTAALSGAYSYSGTTTISGGILQLNSPATLNGNVSNAGSLELNAATLGGRHHK